MYNIKYILKTKVYTAILLLSVATLASGCYSFRGGSLPEHIKTVNLKPIADNSGFGNPTYKDLLYNKTIEKIRSDNSLTIGDNFSDSKLTIIIRSIKEETATTGAKNQIEKERKIVVTVSMEFYDSIKKKLIAKNDNMTISQLFLVADARTARDEAVKRCLDILSDDIINAMIAG
jgi:maltose-binding protein MalE